MSFTQEDRQTYCGKGAVRARICEFLGEVSHNEHPAVWLQEKA